LFGLAAKWKKRRPDRLGRLADAIEAIGERDRKLIEESTHVDHLRSRGAMELYGVCRSFVDRVNARLSAPAILLDPPSFVERNYNDGGPNLFQINLRGRLLQLEFEATDELYESDDFRRPYVLRGAVRSFNQDSLDNNGVDEQMIFYCPDQNTVRWYFLDGRTYRTGLLTEDYLVSEMERLL
jgi:hypothetical protein